MTLVTGAAAVVLLVMSGRADARVGRHDAPARIDDVPAMTAPVWSVAVLQVLVPCALILWVWRRRPATRLEWVTGVAAGASAFAVLAIVLPWSVVPWWMRRVYAVAGLVVVSISVVRSRRRPSVNMPGRRS